MMPKSTARYWPSVETKIFPGCMSAWKKPSRNAWVKKISTPWWASFFMSTPAARRASIWLIGIPWMRSMVSTSLRVRSQ